MGRLVGLDDTEGPFVVACSGGADSLALLALARAAGHDCVAVHVDHGLRAGSAREADVVAAAAAAVGASFRAARVEVGPGPGLEARARDARYRALETIRCEVRARDVLVGHTADDQAETVLLHLLRGSAAPGLAAMAVRRGHVVRPLLALRRADTVEVCARHRWVPIDDPMNRDLRHRRVWVRREVLPTLERGAGRDLRALLARQAAVLRSESDLLDALADEALAAAGTPPRAAALAALPEALARRAVRRWLGSPPPGLDQVDAVRAVAAGSARAAELPGGRRVERAAGRLQLVDHDVAPAAEVVVGLPGRAEALGVRLEAWVEASPPVRWPDGRRACVVDADAAGPTASVRGPRPGERIRPLGLDGSKAVAAALAEVGVAASARARHPVLAAAEGAAVPTGEALWVVGYRIDRRVRVTTRTRRFLWIVAD